MNNFESIIYSVEESVATITLNRPDRMNAFTPRMRDEIIAALDLSDADDNVRAVIFTGSGDRAFCAGADLGNGAKTFDYDSRASATDEETRVGGIFRDGGGMVSLRIFESLKPVIGAINGAAVGVGATMTLPMDIRIASTSARFGFVFSRRGITLEAASSWFLSRAVGMQTALEWCFTGRVFDAAEAKERGLLRSTHEPDQLLGVAKGIAKEIAENTSPVSVALTRQMLWRLGSEKHPMGAHKIDSIAIQSRGKSADAAEGIESFLQKRSPSYPNKVTTDMGEFFPWWTEPTFE